MCGVHSSLAPEFAYIYLVQVVDSSKQMAEWDWKCEFVVIQIFFIGKILFLTIMKSLLQHDLHDHLVTFALIMPIKGLSSFMGFSGQL